MSDDAINPADYTANEHPGKFQGEHWSVEYYYERYCDGCSDEEISTDHECDPFCASLFEITPSEAQAFAQDGLTAGRWFLLYENEQGFVTGVVYDSRDAAEADFLSWFAE